MPASPTSTKSGASPYRLHSRISGVHGCNGIIKLVADVEGLPVRAHDHANRLWGSYAPSRGLPSDWDQHCRVSGGVNGSDVAKAASRATTRHIDGAAVGRHRHASREIRNWDCSQKRVGGTIDDTDAAVATTNIISRVSEPAIRS